MMVLLSTFLVPFLLLEALVSSHVVGYHDARRYSFELE